jgi:error-prone DNA polymerase
MGFRNLQKVNKDDVEDMLRERNLKSFQSVEDFIFRTGFPKDALENMAIANVFASFGLDRRHSFWQSLEFGRLCGKKQSEQFSLFNENSGFRQEPGQFRQMSLLEETSADYRKTGYSLHGNFMRALRLELPWLPPLTSVQLKKLRAGEQVVYAGTVIANQRPPSAKGTGFITLEDECGTVDLILRDAIYEEFKPVIQNSRFLIIHGKIQRQERGVNVMVSRVESFTRQRSLKPELNTPNPRTLSPLHWHNK